MDIPVPTWSGHHSHRASGNYYCVRNWNFVEQKWKLQPLDKILTPEGSDLNKSRPHRMRAISVVRGYAAKNWNIVQISNATYARQAIFAIHIGRCNVQTPWCTHCHTKTTIKPAMSWFYLKLTLNLVLYLNQRWEKQF